MVVCVDFQILFKINVLSTTLPSKDASRLHGLGLTLTQLDQPD